MLPAGSAAPHRPARPRRIIKPRRRMKPGRSAAEPVATAGRRRSVAKRNTRRSQFIMVRSQAIPATWPQPSDGGRTGSQNSRARSPPVVDAKSSRTTVRAADAEMTPVAAVSDAKSPQWQNKQREFARRHPPPAAPVAQDRHPRRRRRSGSVDSEGQQSNVRNAEAQRPPNKRSDEVGVVSRGSGRLAYQSTVVA